MSTPENAMLGLSTAQVSQRELSLSILRSSIFLVDGTLLVSLSADFMAMVAGARPEYAQTKQQYDNILYHQSISIKLLF